MIAVSIRGGILDQSPSTLQPESERFRSIKFHPGRREQLDGSQQFGAPVLEGKQGQNSQAGDDLKHG